MTAEGTQTNTSPKPKARIDSLADMIFGLALSVGAITLVGNPPTDFLGLSSDVAIFAFSFVILISIWLRYTRIFSALPLEKRTIILNIILLFCVSIEPFLFNITNKSTLDANVSTAAYAADLGTMFLILGGFSWELADEEKKLIPKDLIKQYRIEGISSIITGTIFLASIIIPVPTPFNSVPQSIYGISLIISIHYPLRTLVWIVALVFSIARRHWLRRISL